MMFKIIPVLICIITFTSVFIPSIPHYRGDSFFAILALLVGLILAFELTKLNSIRKTKSPLEIPLLVFFLIATLSLTYSVNIDNSLVEYFKLLSLTIIFFSVSFIRKEEDFLKIFLWIVLFASTLASIYGIYEYFFGSTRIVPYQRPLSFFPNPNHFACYLSIGMLIATSLLVFSEQKKLQKFSIILMLSFNIFAFFLANSRGGFLSLILGVTVLTYCRSRRVFRFFVLSLIIGVIVLIIVPNAIRMPFIYKKNISDFEYSRIIMWKDTLHYITDNLWLGTGMGTFREYYPLYKTLYKGNLELLSIQYAHNEFFHLTAEMGIIAFIALIWMLISFFRTIKSKIFIDKKWYFISAFTIFCSLIIQSFFEFNLHTLAISVVLVVIIGSLTAKPYFGIQRKKNSYNKIKKIFRPIAIFIVAILGFLIVRYYLAERYNKIGDFLISQRKYDNAMVKYQKAINLNPLSGKYYCNLYRAKYNIYRQKTIDLQSFEEMERILTTAIILEPRNPFYRRFLARLLISQKEYFPAQQLYESIIRFAPTTSVFREEYLRFLKKINSSKNSSCKY